jgi:hypothetical protein
MGIGPSHLLSTTLDQATLLLVDTPMDKKKTW